MKINPETCPQCPNRRAKAGCPCWITAASGFMETNTVTGEERLVTGCFYQVIPKLMIHIIAAANRPAAAIESTRNELVAGISALGNLMLAERKPSLVQLGDYKVEIDADKGS